MSWKAFFAGMGSFSIWPVPPTRPPFRPPPGFTGTCSPPFDMIKPLLSKKPLHRPNRSRPIDR